MNFSFLFLFFSLFLFCFQHPSSATSLHKMKHLRPHLLAQLGSSTNDTSPTEFFEVTKPIKLPPTKPCSYHILEHDFGFTYGKTPVFANYSPPKHCPLKCSKIVLEWKATCKGTQFDRIFGVWLGGVELLRSCTAEPRPTGIVWTVKKDITRYYSLLMDDHLLAVYLGNIVDNTYTGFYHVDIFFHFYPDLKSFSSDEPKSDGSLAFGYDFPADVILPISRNLPLNDGLWFEIVSSNDTAMKEFKIPQNAYRAVLEVYISYHERDEFWYNNPPNEYIAANNLTDTPGNGPFREVLVTLDDQIIGGVWPFTVIYTGGIQPLLWRPMTGIGSFDLPSYDIEITPFLGMILDGDTHSLGFRVTNALNVWFIDANLHVWLDRKSTKTEGELSNLIVKPLVVSSVSRYKGLNGNFQTSARRSISSTGWVRSSFGNITTSLVQNFTFTNSLVFGKNGGMESVSQTILFNDTVDAEIPYFAVHFVDKTDRKFSLSFYVDELNQRNETFSYVANVTLGFEENNDSGFLSSSLKNLQNAHSIVAVKNDTLVQAIGSTQQVYKYKSHEFCYFRNVSNLGYSILYDKVAYSCNQRSNSDLGSVIFKEPFSKDKSEHVLSM
ncbi:peptide-N4-(N-acetyl-beta-glucosaminyl)asparagine amidase A-like [Neltuma alba]|uniref:peptide-N4-(N-acetyl-beta- glucosaminyl)asparagine amidase A-like n=1 Tax=Neltuma alba TaxID=207710 RepID=UPI0010A554AB|nr:peptide-N4-(N-acetyl-beta-glucosaminyl)asparagine amidase A-like [Prosopis alba]